MKYLCPSFLLLLPRNCLFLTSSFGSFIFTLQFWFVTVSQKPFLTISVLCLDTQSRLTLCDPRDHRLPGSSVHGDSPHKNTGVGCHAFLQGFFTTQGSNPGLPHCRQILYRLSHQGSPTISKFLHYFCYNTLFYSLTYHNLSIFYEFVFVVQSLSCVQFFATPWTVAHQASLSFTISQSLLLSIESMVSSNHLILCHSLLLPSIFPSIRVFSSKSVLRTRWPQYWSFSFSISPSSECSGLISFRVAWLDLPAIRGTLKSPPHHSSKH